MLHNLITHISIAVNLRLQQTEKTNLSFKESILYVTRKIHQVTKMRKSTTFFRDLLLFHEESLPLTIKKWKIYLAHVRLEKKAH